MLIVIDTETVVKDNELDNMKTECKNLLINSCFLICRLYRNQPWRLLMIQRMNLTAGEVPMCDASPKGCLAKEKFYQK